MMEKYLNDLKYSTKVFADKDIMQIIEENAGFVLPDLFIENVPRQDRISYITTKASLNNQFKELGDRRYVIAGNYGDRQLAMDTVMLSSHILEDALVKDGSYSFHSSAVSDGKDAVIIGGSAASGKTTTALSACLNEPQKIKLYSGDRTVIKGPKAIAGSKHFGIRLGSVAYEIPKLKEFVPNHNTKCPWDTAVNIRPETIHLQSDYGPRNIKCFVYPRKGNHDLDVSRINDDRALLRLHEDACIFSDVYPTIILGQRRPMPESRITRDDKQKRLDYVISLAKDVPLLTVNGKLEDIGKCVAEIMLEDKHLGGEDGQQN